MSNVTTYLAVHDANAALEFYTRAFGAHEQYRMANDRGGIGHAELRIGDTTLMLSDEYPELGAVSPRTLGGSCVALVLEVDDVDEAWRTAVEAGAMVDRPIVEAPYGRGGWLRDPFGIRWCVARHDRDVSDEEILAAVAEWAAAQG